MDIAALAGRDEPFALDTTLADGSRLLARDALGTRTLFWCRAADGIRTAGTPGELLDAAGREPDRRAITEWLVHRQVLAPATLFRDVQAMPPGHGAVVAEGADNIVPSAFEDSYDLVTAERHAELNRLTDAAIHDELDRTLLASVGRCCAGAREVGVLMSGGLDSSMLAAMARQFASVTALTMAVDGAAGLNEEPAARAMAARLGIRHEVVRVSPRTYARQAPVATEALAAPLFHVANVGFNVAFGELLARAKALGIARVLAGDSAGTALGVGPGRTTGLRWLLPARRLLARLPAGLPSAMLKLALDRGGLPVTAPEFAVSAITGLRAVDDGRRARAYGRALERVSFLADPLARAIKATALGDLVYGLGRFTERAAIVGARHDVTVELPFHSRAMMRFGLNLPVRHLMRQRGVRFSTSVEKRTLAAIAPRHLGDARMFDRHGDWASPQTAFVAPLAPALLTPDGFCAELMKLTPAELEREVAAWRRDPNALAKHIHLELWGRTCLRGEDPDELGARLEAAVSLPR
ncbi:MAG: asparagine synthase-related protein [Geminicoccaceae bacterium]